MQKITILIFLSLLSSKCYTQQYGWKVIAEPNPGYVLRAVDFVDSLHGWCLTGSGIYATKDGGYTWTRSLSVAGGNSISMLDTLTGWVAQNYGPDDAKIFHTTDGGIHWEEQRFAFNRQYYGVSAQSNEQATISGVKQVIAVRDTGIVVQSSNGGKLWKESVYSDSINFLGKIQFVDSLHGWIHGTVDISNQSYEERSRLLRTTDGGTSWQILKYYTRPFSFIDSLHGFAYGGRNIKNQNDGFYILRTRNGGLSWDSTFTPYASVFNDIITTTALSFTDTLNGWLFGFTFYQGGLSAIIIRTSDGGYTWRLESIGLGNDIWDAIMLDSSHGWAVTSDSKVLSYGIITNVVERLPELPIGFMLKQNYPNPFNSSTNIEYEIIKESNVKIIVYDGLGRNVATLVDQVQPAGVYRLQFDASNLSSGNYYYTMETEHYRNTKQLIHLK